MTPEQEARGAFDRGLDRSTLSQPAQAVWDELAAAEAGLEAIRADHARRPPASPPPRRGKYRLRRALIPAIAGAVAGGLASFLAASLAGSSPAPPQPAPSVFYPSPAIFSPVPRATCNPVVSCILQETEQTGDKR